MNRDFVELLSAFIDHQVDHLVVGAHALAAHGHVRATKDLDVWIRPTPENAARAYAALEAFGAPLFDLEPADLSTPHESAARKEVQGANMPEESNVEWN